MPQSWAEWLGTAAERWAMYAEERLQVWTMEELARRQIGSGLAWDGEELAWASVFEAELGEIDEMQEQEATEEDARRRSEMAAADG